MSSDHEANLELVRINEVVRKACEEGRYRWKIDVTLESMILDPLFWQALEKACMWGDTEIPYYATKGRPQWFIYALRFHEINLTEGWSKAVEYLTEITK